MKFLLNIVKSLVNSGVQFSNDSENSRRIILSNSMSLIFISLALPYSFWFIYLGSLFMGVMVIPFISLYSISILLNRFDKQNYAGFVLIISTVLSSYFYASVYGGESGIQYFLLVLLPATSILFSKKQHRQRYIAMAIILFTYLCLDGSNFTFFFHENLNREHMKFLRMMTICNFFFMLIFIVNFQLKMANNKQMNLNQFLNKYGITERESEIILNLCKGKSNKRIAAELFIGEGTVKVHLQNILKKLNVKSRTEVISFFV
jgi:DNA-binding CsgD family transcriptional regulator